MFRIEKLEIRGFKSFCDRTEVQFPDGITAVVGPNGCGKSNIGDAINWVLGEQSAKHLRGQQMADVIFSGSEARRAVGLAEVSLVFGGASGTAVDEGGRVMLTRRLFRSGESDYLLNGAKTRLKDIQEILREANVGARTYATIEQGKIDQVLNAKPKDRRALIEDAAGISGYKYKRRLAELKLEATHANLLRVNDIVVEVQRQINSLKRQAAKARRYRKLREVLREKELVRFAQRARQLEETLARLTRAEAAARDAEAAAAARLAGLEVRLIEAREEIERTSVAFREKSERLHQREIEIDREEGQIRSCRERISESEGRAERQRSAAEGVAARREEVAQQARALRSTVEQGAKDVERVSAALADEQATFEQAEQLQRALGEEIEDLRRRQFESMSRAAELRNALRGTEEALERTQLQCGRLEADQAAAQNEWLAHQSEVRQLTDASREQEAQVARQHAAFAEDERALAAAREQQAADLESLAQAREREQSVASRLATLEALETRFAGVSDGVKTLLSTPSAEGIRTCGVVADYIETSRDLERAVEGYLQALLPAVILEDDGDARRAADFLRAKGAGRTSLISRSQPAGALAVGMAGNGRPEIPTEVLCDPRVLGRLREKMTLKSSANGVVANRIGDAVIVDSLESALALHRLYPTVDYLTKAGEVIYASGVISAGGQRATDQGLLAHTRQVQETRREVTDATSSTSGLQRRVEAGRAAIVQGEIDLREGRLLLASTERRLLELEARTERFHDASQQSGRRSELLAEELTCLRAEIEPLRLTLQQLVSERQQVEEAHQELERALVESHERDRQLVAEIRQRSARLADLGAEQASLKQRQSAFEQESRRLDGELAEIEARLAGLQEEVAEAAALARSSVDLLARTEADLAGHLEEREVWAGQVREMACDIARRQEELACAETALRGTRTELETCRDATREAELERTRAQSAREHLDDLCRQELGVPASAAGPAEDPATGPVDPEVLDGQVERLKLKIERIGPVNMTAIEEFSDLEQRHGFLTTQREDLDRSMESLKETIRKINRQSRERFTEAFEAIRQSYQEVYKVLFSGGRADLRLEEGDDVLECGIEILAQPPGKRLTGVHLLSGGEKALSALALLFAIFRYQPSPFCLLDEVDAALDDANVGRFIRMVSEYAKNTQFVVITHNKLSMESANLLCGVTMEEPGVSRIVSLQLPH